MVTLFQRFGSIESPLVMTRRPCFHASVSAGPVEDTIALLATLSLRLYIQRFLTSSGSRELSPDAITGILAPVSHPQSLRDFAAQHVYRDLRSDLSFRLGVTLRLTGGSQAHSNRINYLDHFRPVSAAKFKLLMRL